MMGRNSRRQAACHGMWWWCGAGTGWLMGRLCAARAERAVAMVPSHQWTGQRQWRRRRIRREEEEEW